MQTSAAVIIATRHDSHARYVVQALEQRKHVFVEKPLAISREQLATIMSGLAARRRHSGFDPIVMTGFNRRFAPHVLRMKSLLAGRTEPKSLVMTVNAGDDSGAITGRRMPRSAAAGSSARPVTSST